MDTAKGLNIIISEKDDDLRKFMGASPSTGRVEATMDTYDDARTACDLLNDMTGDLVVYYVK